MLGRAVVHDDLPYFFSDQDDAGMEFTGWFPPGGYDRVVTRGDAEAFHSGRTVDPDRLADPDRTRSSRRAPPGRCRAAAPRCARLR